MCDGMLCRVCCIMDLGEKKGGSKMINKTTIKVPKKYEHMVDCISQGGRYKSGFVYYISLSQGYEGDRPFCGKMVTSCVLLGQKEVMEFIRSIRPVGEKVEACEVEAVVETPTEMPDTLDEALNLLMGDRRLAEGLALYSDIVAAVASLLANAGADEVGPEYVTEKLASRFPAWDFADMDDEEWSLLFKQASSSCFAVEGDCHDDIEVVETDSVAPSPECAASVETAVSETPAQAPVDTQAEAPVVDGGERLGRVSFVVVFSNGERLEFYQPCTWTSISRLVKWRLQMEDELAVARVYAGPVADDAYYVRTYAGGRSVADFHKRARNRAHTGGPSPPAMIDCPEPPAGNRLSLPEVLRDLSPYVVAYWEHRRLLFLHLLLTLDAFDRNKLPIPDEKGVS